MIKSLYFLAFIATSILPANAHLGHVGEVAGHGHLIGIGAIIAAAALAALLVGASKSKKAEADPEAETAEDTDEQSEAV